jgi:hypothetical protein
MDLSIKMEANYNSKELKSKCPCTAIRVTLSGSLSNVHSLFQEMERVISTVHLEMIEIEEDPKEEGGVPLPLNNNIREVSPCAFIAIWKDEDMAPDV